MTALFRGDVAAGLRTPESAHNFVSADPSKIARLDQAVNTGLLAPRHASRIAAGDGLRKLRIGWDIDGVLYNFVQAFSDYLTSMGLTHATIENITPTWSFYEGWGLTLKEFLAHYTAAVDSGRILRFGEPYPDTVAALRTTHEAGHTNHIVTDRSMGTEPGISPRHTVMWLAESGYVFDSITFSVDKTVLDADFFLEDRWENYLARMNAGMNCHLITRPYNATFGDNTTQRVRTVMEYVDLILDATYDLAA